MDAPEFPNISDRAPYIQTTQQNSHFYSIGNPVLVEDELTDRLCLAMFPMKSGTVGLSRLAGGIVCYWTSVSAIISG